MPHFQCYILYITKLVSIADTCFIFLSSLSDNTHTCVSVGKYKLKKSSMELEQWFKCFLRVLAAQLWGAEFSSQHLLNRTGITTDVCNISTWDLMSSSDLHVCPSLMCAYTHTHTYTHIHRHTHTHKS